MRIHNLIITALLTLACLAPSAASGGQEAGVAIKTEVIDLYRGTPVKYAIDILRQRYYLPITYEDPVYACPCDLADMTYTRKTPGPKIIVPKSQRLHFEYAEIGGKPQEDITTLVRRLLSEHAAQGGTIFEVRERRTPKGTEWNVIPVRAHSSSGELVDQADILGASVSIPEAQRTASEFIAEMLQQVQTETRYQVHWATLAGHLDTWTRNFGADNVSAREALVDLFGRVPTPIIWEMSYDPESDRFSLTFIWTPQAPNPLTPLPRTPPSNTPLQTGHIPIPAVMRMASIPRGIRHIQSILAQAGYYSGELTGEWDEKTIEALRKFQAANNIPVTGKLDPETIRKLGLDVVTSKPQ
jgi:hypothetical protein